jgi:spectrin alpha
VDVGYESLVFYQDLKANEARLQELNSIADRLTAMGQTEAAEKIREQIAVSGEWD